MESAYYVHPTAQVSEKAIIGANTKIWNWCQVREDARIGNNCILSKGVYVDFEVVIGNNVKIQNNVSLYHGVTIEDGVFIGPHVCFTNDKLPRAINFEGLLKGADDWQVSKTVIGKGVSIGANSTILPGITIGEFAMVGAGSVITRNVPPFSLVYGNPARVHGKVDRQGNRINQ